MNRLGWRGAICVGTACATHSMGDAKVPVRPPSRAEVGMGDKEGVGLGRWCLAQKGDHVA